MLTPQVLREAAQRFNARHDAFAAGKYEICADLAAKLDRYGAFASPRQAEFAAKLVEWSQPRADRPAASAVLLPQTFDLMQRLSKLTIGDITIARKNQDSLCWLKHSASERVVGKIENGVLSQWARPGVDSAAVLAELRRIEQDPEAAAVLHGRISGRCAICNRDLTDPESIARGIGPICAEKF